VAHITGPSLGETLPSAQVILATSGRPLALRPLLPPSHARYLFIRGLPAEAQLSAGRRSGSGAWFVKDEELHDLALLVGEAAKGNYPIAFPCCEACSYQRCALARSPPMPLAPSAVSAS
jgi:hypothetical protein